MGHLVFVLSICLWRKTSTLVITFEPLETKTSFIFGMHTQFMEPFSNETKVNDLVILTGTFILKLANMDFVASKGKNVSQTHLVMVNFGIFVFLLAKTF